jgi:hypothetical protein
MMMINLFSRRNPSHTEEEAPLPKHRSTRKQLTAKETPTTTPAAKSAGGKTGCSRRRRRRREIQASKQSKRDKIVIICNTNMHFLLSVTGICVSLSRCFSSVSHTHKHLETTTTSTIGLL